MNDEMTDHEKAAMEAAKKRVFDVSNLGRSVAELMWQAAILKLAEARLKADDK